MSVDIFSAGRVGHPQQLDHGFGADSSTADLFSNKPSSGQSGGGSINFGAGQSSGSSLNFGNMPQSNSASQAGDTGSDSQGSGGDFNQQIAQVMSEILKMLMQLLQQAGSNSGGNSSNSGGGSGGGSGGLPSSAGGDAGSADAGSTGDAAPAAAAAAPVAAAAAAPADTGSAPAATPGADAGTTGAAAQGGAPATDGSSTPAAADPATSTAGTGATADSAATGDSTQSVGSGPRSFDITNNEDHDITLGMFDKDNQQVATMKLKPGDTGTMNYQNDFTGVIKQADSDGKFQDSASRLEFYNGYVNTSDIDGRNAAISATDHNGFNIGDNKSIADGAPSNIVTQDSAGDKTIAGWYDGSTDTMKAGGQYMEDQLGTGDTYIHPNDDQLGQGSNPMRHTDSNNIDVSFSEA